MYSGDAGLDDPRWLDGDLIVSGKTTGTIMSKTNDTSKLDHAKLENRVLADSELDAVSGGLVVPSIIGILIGPLDPGPISVKEPAPAKHWFNGR
jgi:hypothetical protein